MFQKKSYGEFAKDFAKKTHIPLKAAKALVTAAEPKAKGRLGREITSPKKFKTFVAGVLGAAKEGGRRLYKSGRTEDKFRRDIIIEANAAPIKEIQPNKHVDTAAYLNKIRSGSVLEQIETADTQKATNNRLPAEKETPKPQHIEMAPGFEAPLATGNPEAPINDINIG